MPPLDVNVEFFGEDGSPLEAGKGPAASTDGAATPTPRSRESVEEGPHSIVLRRRTCDGGGLQSFSDAFYASDQTLFVDHVFECALPTVVGICQTTRTAMVITMPGGGLFPPGYHPTNATVRLEMDVTNCWIVENEIPTKSYRWAKRVYFGEELVQEMDSGVIGGSNIGSAAINFGWGTQPGDGRVGPQETTEDPPPMRWPRELVGTWTVQAERAVDGADPEQPLLDDFTMRDFDIALRQDPNPWFPDGPTVHLYPEVEVFPPNWTAETLAMSGVARVLHPETGAEIASLPLSGSGTPGPGLIVASWDGTGLGIAAAGDPAGGFSIQEASKPGPVQGQDDDGDDPDPDGPPPGALRLDLSGAHAELVGPTATPMEFAGVLNWVFVLLELDPTTVEPRPGTPPYAGEQGERIEVYVRVWGFAAAPGGVKVRLKREGVSDSGGHIQAEHDAPRPAGRFGPSEVFYTEFEDNSFTEAEKTFTKWDDFELDYEPSYYGGKERITVEVVGHPQIKATKDLEVRVPGLIELQASPDYELLGETDEHSAASNHWGTQVLVNRLRTVAQEYRQLTGALAWFNDMSLPFGGLFDIDGNWTPSHHLHRTGHNVDMGPMDTYMDAIINDLNGDIYPEGDHWHVTF